MDSEEYLERFLKELNGFHPSIKFNFQKSKKKVNFLNVVVKINGWFLRRDYPQRTVEEQVDRAFKII